MTLVVHLMHGQSNRLLVLIWERDVHCSARLEDLLELPRAFPPAGEPSFAVLDFADDSLFPPSVFRRYNYMGTPEARAERGGAQGSVQAQDNGSAARLREGGKYALIQDGPRPHLRAHRLRAQLANFRQAPAPSPRAQAL